MNQFYVTLPSNTKSDASNTTGSYRVDLAHTIELKGDWEVGLASIIYPYTWNTLKNEKFLCNLKHVKEPLEIAIPDGHYSDIAEMITILNYSFAQSVRKHVKQPEIYFESLIFDYNKILKRVTISIDTNLVEKAYLGLHLQYTLGFGLSGRFIRSHNVAQHPPDVTGGFNSLYVYSDLIKPQFVGDTETQLLRIVPVRGSFGDIVVRDYSTIHYLDVLKKRFDSVEISIKDDVNTGINFQFGKTVLKLHFRKKRMLS